MKTIIHFFTYLGIGGGLGIAAAGIKAFENSAKHAKEFTLGGGVLFVVSLILCVILRDVKCIYAVIPAASLFKDNSSAKSERQTYIEYARKDLITGILGSVFFMFCTIASIVKEEPYWIISIFIGFGLVSIMTVFMPYKTMMNSEWITVGTVRGCLSMRWDDVCNVIVGGDSILFEGKGKARLSIPKPNILKMEGDAILKIILNEIEVRNLPMENKFLCDYNIFARLCWSASRQKP